MALQEHVLLDADNGIHAEDFAAEGPPRVTARRLRGGKSEGIDVVTVDNGRLRVDVLPTRGMGLWRAEIDGHPVGWDSPVRRPVNPAFVEQTSRSGLGWLEGFNELLCRCGLAWNGPPCDDNGWPLTLHGRVANTPAHRVSLTVDDATGETTLTGHVEETGLFGPALLLESSLVTRPGSNRIEVRDVVTNLSDQAGEVELLYHTNLGQPFLEDGGRFHVAAKTVVPRDDRAAEGIESWTTYGPPEPGFAEQAYFVEPAPDADGRATALLHNAAADLGVAVDFKLDTLPFLTLWKCTGGLADGYVTGIEPGSGLPNTRSFERERGRVVTLGPRESRHFSVGFTALTNGSEVQQVLDLVTTTSAEVDTTVHPVPHPDFCVV